MKTYEESLPLKVTSPFTFQYVNGVFSVTISKLGSYLLVTNSYINDHIFVQHNSKTKFIVPKLHICFLNADEMKAEDEMFPGKVSGISDGSTEALVTQ